MEDIIIKHLAAPLLAFLVTLPLIVLGVIKLVRTIKGAEEFEPFAKTRIVIALVICAGLCWHVFDGYLFSGVIAYYDLKSESFETATGVIESFEYRDKHIAYMSIDGQEYVYIRPNTNEYEFDPGSIITIVYGTNSKYIMDVVE